MLIGLVPIFNEEKSIIEVLNRLEDKLDYIVLVNDGSSDKTDFLISDWIRNKENIYYLSFKINRGMSYALSQGFYFILNQRKKGKFSYEDLVITIDADNQHDTDEIKGMYKYFNDNELNVLIAKRDFSSYPKYRIFGNELLSLFACYLGKFKFEDVESGFKILKISFIDDLLKYYTGYRYSCAGEIGIAAALLGYKVDNKYKIQIPYYRKRGPDFTDFFINLIFYFLIFLKIKFYLYTKKSPIARYSIPVA